MEGLSLQPAFFTVMRVFATVVLLACVLCIVHIVRSLLGAVSQARILKASQPEPQAQPPARSVTAQLLLQVLRSTGGGRAH